MSSRLLLVLYFDLVLHSIIIIMLIIM